MTDNKIVKALECCSKAEIYDDCKKMKCPLFLGLSMGCKYVYATETSMTVLIKLFL